MINERLRKYKKKKGKRINGRKRDEIRRLKAEIEKKDKKTKNYKKL